MQINALYIQQKTYENYCFNREDTIPKSIATQIYNRNETFIGIFTIARISIYLQHVIIR